MRSTGRLICLLESVNGTAIDNDIERGYSVGGHIVEICREAAQRLRELELAHQERMEQVGEFLAARGYSNGDIPIADDDGPVGDRMSEEELLRGLEDLFPKDEDGNRGC